MKRKLKHEETSPREEAVRLGCVREFRPCPKRGPFSRTIHDMQVTVERMRLVLYGLHGEEIPSEELTEKELERLCRSLIMEHRKDLPGFEDSWSVLPPKNNHGAPSDARVDFVYKPTYIAISILTRVMIDHPEISDRIPGYKEALRRGYRFSTLRRLMGHGFGAEGDRIENMELFENGGVIGFLSENPEFSPEMHRLLQEIITIYLQKIHNL